MILIGMLHHRKHPESVKKAYSYQAVAKVEGADFIYFSPNAVDLEKKKIKGYKYENGNWVETVSRFPDVIYNTGSPEKLKKGIAIINALKKDIPFTSHSIGNKMRVYKRLFDEEKFKNYLIPSKIVHSRRHFLDYLKLYHNIIFKPVNGHKGQSIYFIKRVKEKYMVSIGTEHKTFEYEELLKFIANKMKDELYLVQPYINCKTKYGQSYDIRLHVQKNGLAKWVITAIYPRFAPTDSIVTNINSGGSTNYIEPFLIQEYGDEYFNKKCYLEQFTLQLARHMDEIQMKYFNETLDELGIDVGMDDLGKIWVYEVNWRPGCPPAFYLELNVVSNMIQYAMSLSKKEGDKNGEAVN